jgi:Family of unknown function (DUF5681)
MLEEAYRPVTVRDGDRTMRMPAIAAIFRSQLASGLKGNGPAQRASLRMIEAIESDHAAVKTEFLKVMMIRLMRRPCSSSRQTGRRQSEARTACLQRQHEKQDALVLLEIADEGHVLAHLHLAMQRQVRPPENA